MPIHECAYKNYYYIMYMYSGTPPQWPLLGNEDFGYYREGGLILGFWRCKVSGHYRGARAVIK